MNTFDCYTTFKACFGEGWEPGVACNQGVSWYTQAIGEPENGFSGECCPDLAARALLLSAAMVACEGLMGLEVKFYPVLHRAKPECTIENEDGSISYTGTGPDHLSRLCSALTQMKEARDGAA